MGIARKICLHQVALFDRLIILFAYSFCLHFADEVGIGRITLYQHPSGMFLSNFIKIGQCLTK